MTFGSDWRRFADRHLGHWTGTAILVSPAAAVIHSLQYTLTTSAVTPSATNAAFLHLHTSISVAGQSARPALRYALDTFHVFADAAYSAEHPLLDLPLLLPPDHNPSTFAVELALPVSATERVRAFLLYDKHRALSAVLLLEEVRSALFDTRPPLALTSLLGEWRGQSQTFRHRPPQQPLSRGFAKTLSPTARAEISYSDDDLPSQLRDPSSTPDGLMRTNTVVRFGWHPPSQTLRRATDIHDMHQNHLGRSVVYGVTDDSGLFDIARFDIASPAETILLPLNNACFVVAPSKKLRGVPVVAELGCLVTPVFRRRIIRMYGPNAVSSETLTSETLAQ